MTNIGRRGTRGLRAAGSGALARSVLALAAALAAAPGLAAAGAPAGANAQAGAPAGAAARAATPAGAAALAPPPYTPIDSTVEPFYGDRIADPYRWLENGADPAVQAWSRAQAARARAYLDALPGQASIHARLAALVKDTSAAFSDLQARGAYVFALYSDPRYEQPMLVTLNGSADPASRRTLVDPNALDRRGLVAIDWFVPSGDGSKLAVSLSRNGSENGTLHVFDVASGREIEPPIADVQYPTAGGSLAWTADDRGFWYTRYPGPGAPAAERHFNVQVYFHALGSKPEDDPLALGHADGLERVSEVFLDNRESLSTVMAMVQRGDGNSWAMYVLRRDGPPVRVASYADDIVYATFGPDGAIYAISRRGSSNGRILKLAPPFAPEALARAPVLIPAADVAIVSGGAEEDQPDLSFDAHHLFVRDIVGGPNRIRIFTLQGRPAGMLPLPPIAGNDEIDPLGDGDVLYDVSTYLQPRYYAHWHAASGTATPSALRQSSPISYADAQVLREFAVSRDGTRVPVNIILKKGTRRDGRNPLLLYGYGGFGISMTPEFAGAYTRLWLDAGGIYAIANIRGGSEYGERWHQQGMLTHKQNDFDDFYAVARHLIERGYTSPAKLALQGASNGGLLMGALITQHPTLARAVVSKAGLYDMLRFETDPNGAFNTTEFGSVSDPRQFRALYAYSPYQHVVAHTPYPAVLLLVGTHDGRVNPLHSRKFAAALQAASSSARPILLRVDTNSGHGMGSSLDERIAEDTDMLSFLFAQLGVRP
ncbi:MAG TPA: prolyl oligopeptidase family serine peptidase [Steroidobacteraceae bacterium]|nr:prolyl oligopeptidase family serine peptidase [Steroidobacteraceae bacterium]